ncbi:MAG: leucine-rich repeat domain-containing protein [Clostridia bacterium]|nr:leucine-rich repeat domain-containing protein [Clostridia bacterium]
MERYLSDEYLRGFETRALPNGALCVTAYTGHDAALTVPSELDGAPVAEIADGCFADCDFLEEIVISEGIERLGDSAFEGCTRLERAQLPQSLERIGQVCFARTALRSVALPPMVQTVPRRAFYMCAALEEARFSRQLFCIEDEAFYGCERLLGVRLPEGIREIGAFAFAFSGLARLNLPYGVREIGRQAFAFCTRMIALELPEGLIALGDSAFNGCIQLETALLPATLEAVQGNPFRSCQKLSEVNISPENPVLVSQDGVAFFRKERRLFCYPCAKPDKSYAFPKGIREIGDYAFAGNRNLETLRLPEGLRRVGEGAFRWCDALARVTVPASVAEIGMGAFHGCERLMSARVTEGSAAHRHFQKLGVPLQLQPNYEE